MTECIFCKIAKGEIPSQKLFEDEQCLVFRDIQPAAPVHLLVIPKEHIQSQAHAMEEHEALLGHMVRVAANVASNQALTNGFRMVVNTGDDGGQTVGHLHMHLLGGRQMHWPRDSVRADRVVGWSAIASVDLHLLFALHR